MAAPSSGESTERFHLPLHILATDGALCGNGLFRVISGCLIKALEKLFRHRALRMFPGKVRITPETVRVMDRRRHSGSTSAAVHGFIPGGEDPWKDGPPA